MAVVKAHARKGTRGVKTHVRKGDWNGQNYILKKKIPEAPRGTQINYHKEIVLDAKGFPIARRKESYIKLRKKR